MLIRTGPKERYVMARYYSIDFDAVKQICTRLEIEYPGEEYNGHYWKKWFRDNVLFCLSKDVMVCPRTLIHLL